MSQRQRNSFIYLGNEMKPTKDLGDGDEFLSLKTINFLISFVHSHVKISFYFHLKLNDCVLIGAIS